MFLDMLSRSSDISRYLKMPVKWHKKMVHLSLKLYQKGGNRSSSNSIHMKNFSVVSPRLQAINAEQVYFQNTPNYSDASFIYVSRHSVSYHTFLVARSPSLAIFDLTFLQAEQLHRVTPSLQYDEYFLFPTN